MRVAIAIQPFGRFGGGEKLAILHALGLAKHSIEVTFYTDGQFMENKSAKELVGKVPIVRLPHSIHGGKVIDGMSTFDRIIVHHHVDPIVAFRLAKIHGRRTLWYTGEVLRAAWEPKTTGQDYRK